MHTKIEQPELSLVEYISKRCIDDIKRNSELLEHIPIDLSDGDHPAQVTNWNAAKKWFANSILETVSLEDRAPESDIDEKTVMQLECYI